MKFSTEQYVESFKEKWKKREGLYILGNLAQFIESFEVATYHNSDHIPLTMLISVPNFNPQTEDGYKGGIEYWRKHVRIRWDEKMRKSM